MGLWLGLSLTHARLNIKAICIGVTSTIIVLSSVALFNKLLVPKEKEQHSWQMVKLYDLAGISVRIEKNLFPEFISSKDVFSMDKFKAIYSPERVDELINDWYESAPIALAKNEEERNVLWVTWVRETINHPIAYLSHRSSIWLNMVSKSPIKPISQLANFDKIPEKVKFILENGSMGIFLLFRELSRFYLMLPFIFIYILWGAYLCRSKNPYGIPLLMLNLAGFSLLLCLFIFSMAADLRYIYLSTCFIFFSHPIALSAFLDKSNRVQCNLSR